MCNTQNVDVISTKDWHLGINRANKLFNYIGCKTSFPSKISRSLFVPESTLEVLETKQKIKMYATTWCGDCRLAKRWFDAHGVDYEYINIEHDERAAELVLKLNNGMRTVPTIIFPDGSILVEPTARELAAKLQG